MTAKLFSSPVTVTWWKYEFNRLWKELSRSEWSQKTNRKQPNPVPNLLIISFYGHPWHGAVGQNIFPMYISIKRHSWFFKSWWCLLYFGHVRMRTAGKSWPLLTSFCLKLSSNAQMSVLSLHISMSRILVRRH